MYDAMLCTSTSRRQQSAARKKSTDRFEGQRDKRSATATGIYLERYTIENNERCRADVQVLYCSAPAEGNKILRKVQYSHCSTATYSRYQSVFRT